MDRDKGGREGVINIIGNDVKNGPWCQEIEHVATFFPSSTVADNEA